MATPPPTTRKPGDKAPQLRIDDIFDFEPEDRPTDAQLRDALRKRYLKSNVDPHYDGSDEAKAKLNAWIDRVMADRAS